MKYIIFIVVFGFSNMEGWAWQKSVAITIDDLPTVPYGVTGQHHKKEITAGILDYAKEHHIPLHGFVNESKLYRGDKPDQEQIELLEAWLSQGMELGNHTFSHMNLHRYGADAFINDMERGAAITAGICNSYGKKYNYLRHPYLRIGKDKAQYDSLNAYLDREGWIVAPVTIDNEDYNFAQAYSKLYASGDTIAMKTLGERYLKYMEEMTLFYERNSQDLFGRQISQVLLLHANLLNSHYLGRLAEMFEKRGYTFVTLEQALKDEAYATEITVFNDWGISWLHWWAMSKGVDKSFFQGEPGGF